MPSPATLHREIREEALSVIVGNEDVIELLTISLLSGGHVLLDGVPGVAKTTIANSVAQLAGLDHNRIQMMPDVLPSDVVGTYMYRETSGEFELRKGPIFANVVVADEINRATAKTQSALLEAMEESTVTIEGNRFSLPEPFILIATQNPLDTEGTYALPIAQRDRFQMQLFVDLLDRDGERTLMNQFDSDPDISTDSLEQVTTPDDILRAREMVDDIHVDDKVKEYILDIVRQTRNHPNIAHGASHRATLAFLKAGKAKAAIEGRGYVTPDDVNSLARNVLVHRLIPSTDAEFGGTTTDELVTEILEGIEAPKPDVETEFASVTTRGDGQ